MANEENKYQILDKEEYARQNNERIKKSNNYFDVEICVSKDENITIPYIKLHNVGFKEIAVMINTLKIVAKNLEEEYPEAAILAKYGMKLEKGEF
jgi:hypothetical protein